MSSSYPDYLATLAELPPRHAGLLFEQLQQATLLASIFMRSIGLSLPGAEGPPGVADIRRHLFGLMNGALDSYHSVLTQRPGLKPHEVFGENGDGLFSVTVTGLSAKAEDGYTAEIDFNLLFDVRDSDGN